MNATSYLKKTLEHLFFRSGLRGFTFEVTPNLYDNNYRLFFYKKYENFCTHYDLNDLDLIASKIERAVSDSIIYPVPPRTVSIEKTFRVSTRYWVSSPNIVMRRK